MSESRGPDVLLAGLCDRCGYVTSRRNPEKVPRHLACEYAGQVTIEQAIAACISAGLIADPDDW